MRRCIEKGALRVGALSENLLRGCIVMGCIEWEVY